MFGYSSCKTLGIAGLSFLLFLFTLTVSIAQELVIADDLEKAVENLVDQLEDQLEPYLDKEQLAAESRLLVFNVKPKNHGLRWGLSQALEEALISEISAETHFVLLSSQKVHQLQFPYWREMGHGKDYQIALKIAQATEVPLVLSGTFVLEKETVRIQLQLIAVQNEEIYASLDMYLSTQEIPEKWLKPLPIYQNRHHLETARAFIAEEEWELAHQALQQVSRDLSSESIEAQGLLLWLMARRGEAIAEEFIPFKTLHPQHPLVPQIEQEWQTQLVLQEWQQALAQKAWLAAKDLLQHPLLQKGNRGVVEERQRMLEEAMIQWQQVLLKQKNWQSLKEQWKLFLQIVKSAKTQSVLALKQKINHQLIQQLHDFTNRKDRSKAMKLLEHLGPSFLETEQQQQTQKAIAAIPLPPAGMVTLPGTTFEMGTRHGKASERPVHTVTLKAFHLDQYEVTNEEYQTCVVAKQCTPNPFMADDRFNGQRQPVVGATWYQAHQYCQWQKKRLPTEAEWERAAEDLRPLEDYAWFAENSGKRTREVGTRKPNSHGLYDLLGNALEWVQDYYTVDYYAWSPTEAPQGPRSGDLKAARGGSWFHAREGNCVPCRYFWSPSLVFPFLGFRCAISLN